MLTTWTVNIDSIILLSVCILGGLLLWSMVRTESKSKRRVDNAWKKGH